MSPILDIQIRMRELGRVRMGAKGTKGEPKKLTKFRLTSASRAILEAAAADDNIGGKVQAWDGAPDDGYWELYTDTDTLDIILPPTFSEQDGTPSAPFSQWYELWSGGGCQRRCDGQRETLNDTPCLCDPDNRECKITTRINFMLPGLPDIGVWRLDSHGYYAAIETPGTLQILRLAAEGQDFIPATLRIEQRTKKTPGGPVRKFVVPIVELRQSIMELAAGDPRGSLAFNPPGPRLPKPQLPAAPAPTDTPFERDEAAGFGEPPPLPKSGVVVQGPEDPNGMHDAGENARPGTGDDTSKSGPAVAGGLGTDGSPGEGSGGARTTTVETERGAGTGPAGTEPALPEPTRKGGLTPRSVSAVTRAEAVEQRRENLTAQLLELANKLGKYDATAKAVEADRMKDQTPAAHLTWLERQIANAEKKLAK